MGASGSRSGGSQDDEVVQELPPGPARPWALLHARSADGEPISILEAEKYRGKDTISRGASATWLTARFAWLKERDRERERKRKDEAEGEREGVRGRQTETKQRLKC